MTGVIQQVEETEQQLIDTARAAVAASAWVVGECASKWTKLYARGRSDEAFGELVDLTRDQVRKRRQVWERFGKWDLSPTFITWTHFREALNWDDAEECLQWAEGTQATVTEMKAWRKARNGEPLSPDPVKPPTQQASEPHEPIVQPIEDEPEPLGEVQQSAKMPAAPVGNGETDTAAPVTQSPPVDTPRPHVSNNSGEVEWYTPAELIEAAREVMGDIDLDPASCETANEVVNAAEFYDKEQDGMSLKWHGRVFMNPPYAAGLVGGFTDKLLAEISNESVTEACVLVNNATETKWFQALAGASDSICFPKSRIRFWNPDREDAMTGLQGQAVLYFGINTERFRTCFSKHGVTVTR